MVIHTTSTNSYLSINTNSSGPNTSVNTVTKGYNLCVDYDLQPIGMENTTDGHVEFVKLVDGLCRSDIPEDTIIQDKVISGVKGGTILLVVVGKIWVEQSQQLVASLNIIDLLD